MAMPPTNEGIQIVRLTTALDVDVEPLREELTTIADVRLETEEPGVHALLEWLLPAAFMVNVGAPFLKGFMEKMGGVAGEGLGHVLVGLFERLKARSLKWRGSSGQEQPVTPIRLAFTLPGGADAAFVFPSDLSKDQVQQGLRDFSSGMAQAQERDKARGELLDSIREMAAAGDTVRAMEMFSSEEAAELRRRELVYVYRPSESAWIEAYELMRMEAEKQFGIR
jgi:hypothetical protein